MATDTPKECTLTLEDGTHYDLSSLSSSKADYEAPAVAGGSGYKLNVCRSVVGELWLDDPEDVGGYISREQGDFSLGSVNVMGLLYQLMRLQESQFHIAGVTEW
jgi:cation-dependent mannose-6-phosphate receptor